MVCDCYLPDCPQCDVLLTAERHGCIQPQDNKDGKAELPHGGELALEVGGLVAPTLESLPAPADPGCHSDAVSAGIGL